MIRKISKKAIPILMVFFLLLNVTMPVFAAIDIGDTSHLYGEKELPGLLEIKADGSLKLVVKVYYKDPDTGKKLYAFCVEPSKPGVGSGATDFGGYDSYVKEKLQSDELWRCLYFGYIGVDWRDTTVECDDDWYFVTKTVVHCLVNGKSPKETYKVPTWITNSDKEAGLTLKDVQRRGQKVLNEAEKLYNKCLSSNEKYEEAKVSISKSGNTYTEGNYEVQNFKIDSNKTLGNYDVTLSKFPSGTTYEKNGSTLKVKIPRANITGDIDGLIYLTNVQVETCGAFYAEAYNSEFQDYIIAADPYEVTSARTPFELTTAKSIIKVEKTDEDTKKPISGVTFQLKTEDGKVVQNATTNEKGIATFSNLRPGKYIVVETATNDNYILDTTENEVNVGYDTTITKELTNKHKEGNLKVYKVDADNNEIRLGNVQFDLYSVELDKIIGTYTTNVDGEIYIENLRTGEYKLIEKNTGKWYNLAEDTEVKVEWNTDTETTVENELKKGQVKVIKVDEDNNEIKLQGVEFEVLDSNGNVLEKIVTDENGEALTQRYPVRDFKSLTLREVKTLDNYVLNDKPITVELTANETTAVTIENERIKGKVEITKVDSKDNSKVLEGAKFGLYDENDNLIETLVTDENGKAISQELYKGKYYLKELDSGSVYYLLNEDTFEFEIVNNGETVPVTIDNEPVDITVDVDKKGTVEIKPGEEVNYTFSNVANNSNVYLENFKWYDYIPTDYIRLQKMTTGTWNQDLKYDVYYKTNKSDEYILFKEDLSTQEDYELDFTKIKLADDEYITETCFDFGRVETGFRESTSPTMNCISLDTLKDNDTFTNHTKTVGTYYGVTAEADSDWTTVVHIPEKPTCPTLPRTGR